MSFISFSLWRGIPSQHGHDSVYGAVLRDGHQASYSHVTQQTRVFYNSNTFQYFFSAFGVEFRRNTGMTLYMEQFYAMVIKRAIHTWRNKLVSVVFLIHFNISFSLWRGIPSQHGHDPVHGAVLRDGHQASHSHMAKQTRVSGSAAGATILCYHWMSHCQDHTR